MLKSRNLVMALALFTIALFFPFRVMANPNNVSSNQDAVLQWFGSTGAKYEKVLGIQIKELTPDKITLEMAVSPEKHTNYLGIVHGGAIMSLADTAMAVACVNQGKAVVTIDFNINFIRKIEPEGTVTAIGYIIHHGSQTMVAEAEIYDKNNQLAAKARGTFFVTGKN